MAVEVEVEVEPDSVVGIRKQHPVLLVWAVPACLPLLREPTQFMLVEVEGHTTTPERLMAVLEAQAVGVMDMAV
jgi:hypothetical protein